MTNDIVIFETNDKSISLPVQVTDDTVWLTQTQMTELFSTTKQNISSHINNCFKEKELDKNSVVKDFLTTASDGKSYRTNYYNLDVIISVGYRVKSQRGVEFRRWANGVLKQYVLNGVAANLLYLIVKDHPFNDGCKRIAATLFLVFLQKNGMLVRKDGTKLVNNGTLAAITLLVAESDPEEKDIMISLIMNMIIMA